MSYSNIRLCGTDEYSRQSVILIMISLGCNSAVVDDSNDVNQS